MSEEKLTTICFMGTAEQKALLEQWGKQEDRSVSYVLRQLITREAQRRGQAQPTQKVSNNAN